MSREDDAGALLTIAAGQYLYAAAAVHYALVGAIDTPRPLAPSLSMYTYTCMLASGLLSLWCLIAVLAVPGAAAQADEVPLPFLLMTATLISVQAASLFTPACWLHLFRPYACCPCDNHCDASFFCPPTADRHISAGMYSKTIPDLVFFMSCVI